MGRVRDFFARITKFSRYPFSDRVFAWVPRSSGGVWLTHEEAIRLSAVWACVSVISKAIASSNWEVFREDKNGDRDYQPASRSYYLLNTRPNPETTPIGFHETMLAIALLWGNSYSEIERDAINRPAAMWPLEPERCTLERDPAGRLVLRVTNQGAPDTYLDYNDVYHIHGLGLDGSCGLDLVSLAARSLLQALAAEKFGLQYYENGTSMGGVLSTDQNLPKEKLEAVREEIEKRHKGTDNAFKFLLLSGGWKWNSLTQTLNDGQFNENRYYLIEEVCRWFGVPPHKIAHLLRATFSNIEHQGIEFQRDALRPWAKRCEQEADYKLLPPGPLTVSINLEWAAEGDAKSKAETDAILVDHGLLKRNEARRRRGLNSVGKVGELLTVQAQMTTLEKIMEAPPPGRREGAVGPQQESQQTEAAAQALYASAMKRVLRRLGHRATDAAARAKSPAAFAKRMEAEVDHVTGYLSEQLAEVGSVLYRVGVDFSADGVFAEASKYLRNYIDLIDIEYQNGRLDFEDWIDVESASYELAGKAVDAMKGAVVV